MHFAYRNDGARAQNRALVRANFNPNPNQTINLTCIQDTISSKYTRYQRLQSLGLKAHAAARSSACAAIRYVYNYTRYPIVARRAWPTAA